MDLRAVSAVALGTLLMAGTTVTGYHMPDPEEDDVATEWTGAAGFLAIKCESLGMQDPVNPGPLRQGGVGGICYASSQQFWNEETATWDVVGKEAKSSDADVWSFVEPICMGGEQCPGESLGPSVSKENDPLLLGNWFARVGNNAHGCIGYWGQQFVYKEGLAYWWGSAPDAQGVSGHVSFFVNDPLTMGAYFRGKGASAPDEDKTSLLCNGEDVGLGEGSGQERKKEPRHCVARVTRAAGEAPKVVTAACLPAPPGPVPCNAEIDGDIVTVTCLRGNGCQKHDVNVVSRLVAGGAGTSVETRLYCGGNLLIGPATALGPAPDDAVVPGQKGRGDYKCEMVFTTEAGFDGDGGCHDAIVDV